MTFHKKTVNTRITVAENVREKYPLRKYCNKKIVMNRFPITKWLPSYDFPTFFQDLLAGTTVGATAVAQGIAYAVVAGLPPAYGLYSGIMGGFIYVIFGNCRNMSIGPTAILSAMTAKYVNGLSVDLAILATFLAGIIQLCMGIFQLGFLIEFLSGPVINGFVTAATVQIISSQLKPLFGTDGSSGNVFVDSIKSFIINIKTVKLWDSILGVTTIVILILLKKLGQGCSRCSKGEPIKILLWFISVARNVIVVILGISISYVLHLIWKNNNILTLVKHIDGGLPKVQLPAFRTTIGNNTYEFGDMLEVLGPQSIVLPFVAILEVVVISKAFTTDSNNCDSMQEIIALGLCNIVGSFLGSMPITGAFSRSALFHASGAQTPAAGAIVSIIVLLSLSLLTSMFSFIPKSVLAALIITAVTTLVHVDEITHLWRNSKREFIVLVITMMISLVFGLEYGVIVGVLVEILFLLYQSARPVIIDATVTIGDRDVVVIPMPDKVVYLSGEYIRKTIIEKILASNVGAVIILDGTNMQNIDTTVASNIISILKNVNKNNYEIYFLNFKENIQNKFLVEIAYYKRKFVNDLSLEKLIQSLQDTF